MMDIKILVAISFVIVTAITIFVFSAEHHIKKFDKNQVNSRVKELFISGDAESVYSFYDSFIKNRTATINIVNNALLQHIPIHYFIAISHQESQFNPNSISKKNKDGSYDIGLFQLNSKSYRKYDRKYLLNIENNIKLAAIHLSGAYGNSNNWYSAIGIYNAGNEKNIVFSYVKNILVYADMLDCKFFEKYN